MIAAGQLEDDDIPPPPEADEIPPPPPEEGDIRPEATFVDAINTLRKDIADRAKLDGFKWENVGNPATEPREMWVAEPTDDKSAKKHGRTKVTILVPKVTGNLSSDPAYRKQSYMHGAARVYVQAVSNWIALEKRAGNVQAFSSDLAAHVINAGRALESYSQIVSMKHEVKEHVPSPNATKYPRLARWFPSWFPGKLQSTIRTYPPAKRTQEEVKATLDKSSRALRELLLSGNFDASVLSKDRTLKRNFEKAIESMGIKPEELGERYHSASFAPPQGRKVLSAEDAYE